MGGDLISYGDALKAFRRNVYTHAVVGWHAAVICATHQQARYAMDEAKSILDASSLPVQSYMHTSMRITTDRGGRLNFFPVEHGMLDRMQGLQFPHIIVVTPQIDTREREFLKYINRHHEIEERYYRFDEAML
jgi:hypothetical protein